MNISEKFQFIWIVSPALPVIVRVLEISKRLLKENVDPIILMPKKGKRNQFKFNQIGKIPSKLKMNYLFLFYFKSRFLAYLEEVILKICFLIHKLPLLTSNVKEIFKSNPNIKMIYSTGPYFYNHILGYFLKKKFHLPLCVEYTDPWYKNPYKETHYKQFEKIFDPIIEKKILQFADIFISNSPYLNSLYNSYFPFLNEKPIVAIEDGLEIQEEALSSTYERNKIVLLFAGSIYGKRNILPFLKIISDLKKERFFIDLNFQLKIFGQYSERPLKNIIHKSNLQDIVYLGGFIPRSKVLKEIEQCTLALHIGENIDYPTIAGKVWEYLSYGKKMIFISQENTYRANFIKDNNLGIVIPIDDLNKAKQIFKDLISDVKNNKFLIKIEKSKILEFSWDNRAKKFLKNIIEFIQNLNG